MVSSQAVCVDVAPTRPRALACSGSVSTAKDLSVSLLRLHRSEIIALFHRFVCQKFPGPKLRSDGKKAPSGVGSSHTRWARPRADTTRSLRWYTQQLSLVTARLRWRSLGSSLALTCGLPWPTPALPLTSFTRIINNLYVQVSKFRFASLSR